MRLVRKKGGEETDLRRTKKMTITLPLELGPLDHYTLIVEDAAAVARFHTEVLGFEPLRIQLVNAGTAPPGGHDMLNHVLQIPGTSKRVLVVTEGLTETSIFRRYLQKHGPGVHHVAYEVADLDGAVEALRKAGIGTTSERVLNDPLTGLRQIFINREFAGYFIELIERNPKATAGHFTNDNMAALARTMISYLKQGGEAAPTETLAPQVEIKASPGEVRAFLLDPFHLPRWTVHRCIRRVEGQVVEVRLAGDLPLTVTEDRSRGAIVYRWAQGDRSLEIPFFVAEEAPDRTSVRVDLPPLPPARLARTAKVIQAELDLLACHLEGRTETFSPTLRALLDEYHLEVHQRIGL
ncbi:MAG: VOC family protein [Polyangiaceae bacterium]|nr:VOC family protein [Polyangiaceae bacterium]